MRRKSLSLLLVAGVAWTFAPIASADPFEREGRDGHPRAERERDDLIKRAEHHHRDHREGPRRHHGPGGPRGAAEPGRMMRMRPLVAALDADKDRSISAEEIENASAALKMLDKNGDGKLDLSELRPNFVGDPGPPRRDARRSPRRDGRREMDRNSRGRGGRGHADRRGGQPQEHSTHERGPRDASSMMERLMKLDQDDDGALSADELTKLPERGQRLMKIADIDEDGSLSSDELAAMKERGKELRRERRKSGKKDEK